MLLLALLCLPAVAAADQAAAPAPSYRVEIWLARDQQPHEAEIRKQLAAVGVKRLTISYVRQAPKNFAVGRDTSAELARLLIALAERHIGGVQRIIAEQRFFPDFGTIGSSQYDEIVQVPIDAEDLERLKDPGLSTEAWHKAYRRLTGEEQ